MFKVRFTFPFLTCCLIISISLHGQESRFQSAPFIENYSAEDYQAGIQNWDITQSEDGRLYVANNLGLLQYDGSNWQNHQIQYGTKLRSLLISEDKVYVGSQNDFGFFQPNTSGRLRYTSLADSLSQPFRGFDETWKIYQKDSVLYFCTFNYIFEYRENTLKAIASEYPLEISFWIDHQLLVQEWGRGLSKLDNGQLSLIPGGEFFLDKRISAILHFNKQTLLISTFNDGLFQYTNGEIVRFNIPNLPNNSIINDALMLKDGRLVLASQTQGIYIFDYERDELINLNKDQGLLDNTVNAIYQDLRGSLWLSLNNGLSRVDLTSPLSMIDERAGISGAGYAALKTKEKTYFGTNIGAYAINGKQSTFIEGSAGQVYSIRAFDDKVYLGHHEGLMMIEGNQAIKLNTEKGAWDLIQVPDRSNLAILGTYNGIRLFDLVNNKVITSFDGFTESARVMAFEGDILWITQGYKGAYRLTLDLEEGKVLSSQLYNASNGFPSDFLINVFEIDGELLFTAERGFYRFYEQNDKFVPAEDFNALLGNDAAIVDLEEDDMGNIYFIERDRIGRLNRTVTRGYEVFTNHFGSAKNIWNDDLGNITVLSDEEVLIGAREGFVHYNRSEDRRITPALSIGFEGIEVMDEGADPIFSGHGTYPKAPIVLPYEQNSLSFSYYSPDFQSGDQTEYQFYLENYQNDWSEWTNNHLKEFTNLREGNYTFHVRARNVFDQQSETISFSFQIEPPIYRTTAAYVFYAGGTLFLLFLGFKTLDHRHKEATKALEESKNSELEKKNQHIKTIAEQSEKEIDLLRNEKLEAELKLKSQDLTSSAMHLIQKNELLNQVKKTLKGLDKDHLDEEANAKLRTLVRHIDQDLASGEEWAQFENNFDQVHGNFITRLKEAYPKLTPQEIKFSAYLRMNLNTKEIAKLLNISVRGVEIGRYRVRKKLALERKDNLNDFLMRF